MLDISSDTATPQPIKLADYRPPAFLIDTVDLTFELDHAETRVKSRLPVRRNPQSLDPAAPLALDGEGLGANRYQLTAEGGLVIDGVPDAFAIDIETRIDPQTNSALSGLYVS